MEQFIVQKFFFLTRLALVLAGCTYELKIGLQNGGRQRETVQNYTISLIILQDLNL